MNRTLTSLTICMLLGAGGAFAQGTAFTYQGRLNSGVNPANGVYDISFALYDALSGGTQQGSTVIKSSTVVSNGLFTVTLDFGSQFSGAARWLELGARTNGGGAFDPMTPRQPLTPAPYAEYAAGAASVAAANIIGMLSDASLSANVALRSGGNTFSGAQVLTGGSLFMDNAQTIAGKNASGSYENFLWPRWSDNVSYLNYGSGGFNIRNNSSTSVMFMRNNGNIGLGVTTPNFPMAFSSTLGDKISLFESGGGNHYGFGVQSFQLQIHSDTPAADIVFGSGQSTSLVETMRIKGTGNVGIGTANPNANTLQINTNFHASSGYALTASKADFGVNVQINRTNGQSGLGLVVDNSSSGNASTSLLLVRNNVAAAPKTLLNVQADGNVGIGVASPQQLLQVGSDSVNGSQGMIRFGSRTTNVVGGAARAWDAGVPQTGDDATGLGYSFVINDATANTNRFIVRWDTGNVGVGVISPTNKLHVAGGVSATAFVNTSDRNAKENFAQVSPEEVLNKVAALPISTWNFKTMNDGRHMGPMAQDFYAAFHLGGGDTTITSMDPDGVALAAIQGLNEKVETGKQKAEIRIEKLEAENADLRVRLEKLERLLHQQVSGGGQ